MAAMERGFEQGCGLGLGLARADCSVFEGYAGRGKPLPYKGINYAGAKELGPMWAREFARA